MYWYYKMKNKIIKLSFVFMLLISATTFSACAQVRAMTITNQDDTIDELVSVSLDQVAIVDAGYNITSVKNDIETNSLSIAEDMKNELNLRVAKDMLTATTETKKILLDFKDGISVVKSSWENNTYVIGIRFKNIDIYKYYYDITDNQKVEMQREEHFFYDKVYYYASTMYVKHNALYNSCYNYFSAKYPNLIESETNELLYSYKTDLRRQHSDADYITYNNGEYYHTWVVDSDNLDEPIMLYYNIANPENYIIISLGITFGLAIVLGEVAGIIKIVQINKNKNIKEETD